MHCMWLAVLALTFDVVSMYPSTQTGLWQLVAPGTMALMEHALCLHGRRALGSKTAQALLLLRTLAANNINRLAKRLDSSSQRQLRELVSGWPAFCLVATAVLWEQSVQWLCTARAGA